MLRVIQCCTSEKAMILVCSTVIFAANGSAVLCFFLLFYRCWCDTIDTKVFVVEVVLIVLLLLLMQLLLW